MWSYNYTYPNYLAHYGVLGMKWGVRRYQNKDGSLTSAGKKRYNEKTDSTSKTSREDVLYEQYKNIGYSNKKAAEAAKDQVKLERKLKIIGAVAATAAVAYVAARYYDDHADRVIEAGKTLQRVHQGDIANDIAAGSPFYATYTKADNTIYASRVFSHFKDTSNVTQMYTKNGIKVASEASGRKLFKELMDSDPTIATYAKSIGIGKSTSSKTAYRKFNQALVRRSEKDDNAHNIFYNALKKAGYGAVMDVNDSRVEGFTYHPVIVFDDQKKYIRSTTKATAEQLSASRSLKAAGLSMTQTLLNHPINKATITAGMMYLSSVGATKDKSTILEAKSNFVETYRDDHPNTKLTNAQIARMYESSH